MRIELTHEGANALRDFANAMPLALENITTATENVIREYQSLEETLGVHREQYFNMLMAVKKALDDARTAIEELPSGLNTTADKIDAWVNTNP